MAHGTADWWSRTRALMDLRFKDLTDTPGSYADKAGTVPEVTVLEDGLEFSATVIDDHSARHEPGGGDAIDPGTFNHDALGGIVANNHHERYTDAEAIAALGYSAGNWTPDLQFGGAKVGITYSRRTGNYVRIGAMIYGKFSFSLTSKGTSVGEADIYGLPINAAGVGAGSYVTYYSSMAAGITFMLRVFGTRISLGQSGGVSLTDITNADFTDITRMDGFFVYNV